MSEKQECNFGCFSQALLFALLIGSCSDDRDDGARARIAKLEEQVAALTLRATAIDIGRATLPPDSLLRKPRVPR